MRLIDSHAHLTHERVAADTDAVLARAREAGLEAVVTVASNAADARAGLALARRFPDVWATAGVHPHDAHAADEAAYAEIAALLAEPRVVAVGETGLDYHYDFSPRGRQRDNFLRHLDLARETGKPLIVHAREADDDLIALLREAGRGTLGVLHSFSSGAALLDTALELGWWASFSGMVTFRTYAQADLLRRVPGDRLMVETDTPYLAPVPHRGKTNEPAFVAHVAAAVAAHRSEDADEVAARTTGNARRFFRLDG